MAAEFRNIVVVDDDQQSRYILDKYIRTVPGYNPTLLSSGMELINYCKSSTPDIILLDIEMPGISGIQAFAEIRAMGNMDGVPVVFLTGKEDKATVLRCISMGADGYMVKPVARDNLLAKLKEIFDKLNEFKNNKTILMIDDDVEFLKISKLKLSKYYKVLTVDSGKTALDYLAHHSVDLIILDYFMPLYNGNNILNILKHREATKKIPVIMASALSREEIESACAKNMPDGIVSKPVKIDELLALIQLFIGKLY